MPSETGQRGGEKKIYQKIIYAMPFLRYLGLNILNCLH